MIAVRSWQAQSLNKWCVYRCYQMDDYSPAKNLMTMCFTYYYIGKVLFILSIIFTLYLSRMSLILNCQSCYCFTVQRGVELRKELHGIRKPAVRVFCEYGSSVLIQRVLPPQVLWLLLQQHHKHMQCLCGLAWRYCLYLCKQDALSD